MYDSKLAWRQYLNYSHRYWQNYWTKIEPCQAPIETNQGTHFIVGTHSTQPINGTNGTTQTDGTTGNVYPINGTHGTQHMNGTNSVTNQDLGTVFQDDTCPIIINCCNNSIKQFFCILFTIGIFSIFSCVLAFL